MLKNVSIKLCYVLTPELVVHYSYLDRLYNLTFNMSTLLQHSVGISMAVQDAWSIGGLETGQNALLTTSLWGCHTMAATIVINLVHCRRNNTLYAQFHNEAKEVCFSVSET